MTFNRRLKADGVGYVGNAVGLGFYIHPTLLVEVEESGPGRIAGYSSIQIWHRDEIKGTRKNDRYKSVAIEEKESYKWIRSADESKARLPSARRLTMIGDREADFGKKSSMITINEQGTQERQPLSVLRSDFWVSTSNKQLNFLQHINQYFGQN